MCQCSCVFHCGLVYESGSVFSPDVLDITEEDILGKFLQVMTEKLHSYVVEEFLLAKC